ncbi:hypothetical protein JB92DRAFT_3124454 [Gautieria morchelliformis]|nr:hypothetical protein JB92DRAFT_3124454 [Gautieria morchelliformis]
MSTAGSLIRENLESVATMAMFSEPLCRYPDSVLAATLLTITIPPKSHFSSIPTAKKPPVEETLSVSLGRKEACETKEALLSEFGVEGVVVEELLCYDEDGMDEEEEEEVNLQDDTSFVHFEANIHITAVQRAEGNSCAGGLKAQKYVVKFWNVVISTPCAWAHSDYRPKQMFCE